MTAKKKRLIIISAITAFLTIMIVTLFLGGERFKDISEMDTPTILFVRAVYDWQSEAE